MLNKTEQITHLQGQNRNITIQEVLTGYRSTPNPATNTTPYKALMNRPVRTKLDHQPRELTQNAKDSAIDGSDRQYKETLRKNAENRNTKEHNLIVGDFVLLKQSKKNKWSTAYEPAFYIIYRIDNSSIAASRVTDGREVYRDASHFKLASNIVCSTDEAIHQNVTEPEKDWREDILLHSNTKTPSDETIPHPDKPPSRSIFTPPDDSPQTHRTSEPHPRPQRNRQRPAYLKDFVC